VNKIQVLEAENESLRLCLQKYAFFISFLGFGLTLNHRRSEEKHLSLEEKYLSSQRIFRNLELELSGKVQASEKEIAVLYVRRILCLIICSHGALHRQGQVIGE
jgi:hypothetical protein